MDANARRIFARVRIDVAFGAFAILFGLPSLAFPFGRDQGLFFYAAREWLERGQVLYRDVWDHKPPVIYFLHMLAIAVFGAHRSSIRILELFIAVPAVGFLAARLVTPRGEPLKPGTLGAAWLVASVTYYGWFDYWDSAQCEIWCAVFSLAALASAMRIRRDGAACFLAGLFSAIALFTKPPALPYVLLVVAALVSRFGRRAAPRALGMFVAGGLAFSAPLLAYFAAKHALGPMIDIVIRANSTYVSQERNVTELYEIFTHTTVIIGGFQPMSDVLLGAIVVTVLVGFARGDRALVRRHRLPLALAVCAWLAVVMQLKFYFYHWGTIIAAFTVLGAQLWEDLVRLVDGGAFPARSKPWLRAPFFLFALLLLFACDDPEAERFFIATRNVVRLERGQLTRPDYAQAFDKPGGYSCRDPEVVGAWLADNARDEDTVAVRGFEPEVYAISSRHYTGRFYWTTFLTGPGRAYRRAELLAEDAAELDRHPPRFVVVPTGPTPEIDSADYFTKRGYAPRFPTPTLLVLERNVP